MEKNAIMAGRHRTTGNGILELSDAWITRAMAARGRIGPLGVNVQHKAKRPARLWHG